MQMSTEKILVMGPSWVGDMVMAHSLFQAIKKDRPAAQIDVAAPAWTLPLLDRMPEVSNKIALPFKHGQLNLMERIGFGRSLRDNGYTQSITLVNTLKSAILPFAAGIPKRTGFLGEMRYGLLNDIRPLNKEKLGKTVERFVALGLAKHQPLGHIPRPVLKANKDNAIEYLGKAGITLKGKKLLGLCPGAEYGEAKRWPISHFAQTANMAIKQGWQVILFGSDKDASITNAINVQTKAQCIDLGGKTNLGEAIDIMSLCNTVISNDSGLMHIAAALDKKLIAIFGSSDPEHTPPMHPDAVIEYLGLECSPCFERACPLGHTNCLKKITAIQITNLIKLN